MLASNGQKKIALRFFNALYKKSDAEFRFCLGSSFQDVLPNGTLVTSKEQLLSLHVHFMTDTRTGFRPHDGENREFSMGDLQVSIESDDKSIGFYRVAAQVDRPNDFRDAASEIVRRFMYLGVVVRNNTVEHIQNTLFDPKDLEAH